MVVIERLATIDNGVVHDRTAIPSMCTVQAPHKAAPHPYLVPVNSKSSLNVHSRVASDGVSTCTVFPFSLKVVFINQELFVQKVITSEQLKFVKKSEEFLKIEIDSMRYTRGRL